eukprot:GHRR01011025.1.p1 GENE.GHRR01011025.1~~GHRR01011025.1.p1  ORF type:complete len:1017 (+),score=386.99 GHRR01011025.1:232-3282(+)
MASDRELRTWVADQLHTLVGYSDKTVADFILASAKKSKDGHALVKSLSAFDIKGNGVHSFAEDLLLRLPRSSGRNLSQQQRQHQQARQLVKRNKAYGLLDEDSEIDEPAAAAKPLKPPKPSQQQQQPPAQDGAAGSKSKQHRQHIRSSKESVSDQADDDRIGLLSQQYQQRRKRKWEEDEADEQLAAQRAQRDATAAAAEEAARIEAKEEAQRERDQREKEEFEERLRARDEARTQQKGGWKEGDKDRQRRAIGDALLGGDPEADAANLVPILRDVSRQEYLKKREEAKLQALKDELEDEKYLFEGMQMTEREKADYAYKQRVYELAMERRKALESLVDDGYKMPTNYDAPETRESRYKVALQRYQPDPSEAADAAPGAEQERWEAEQAKRTRLGGGNREVLAEAAAKDAEKYELLFDDQIEYVKNEVMKGDLIEDYEAGSTREKAEKAKIAALETERQRMAAERASLPIYPYREELLAAVEAHQILILVAETGAGKTTQVPQYLHEAGYSKLGMIGCTQPRRVAAMSVAARVSHEMGFKLGNEVGYSIRFEDCTSEKTFIKYMTDGMLLREFLGEPDLAKYSVMMIDEAHERTLSTDVLFGLVKDIARFRPDLKLLISSATLDAQKFSDYFDMAPIFRIPGRRYPVDILYSKAPEADYVDACISTVLKIHISEPAGDVLVFLTGQEEIEAAEELLKTRTRGLGTRIAELMIAPIYANLPSDLQAKIFEPTPAGARKVVLATNIAETSLTIDGIRYVIDPGFAKQNEYNPRTGMESLLVAPISKASAMQRAGRAGRTAPGKCFRVYTAFAFEHEMDDNTTPEIQRTNLANVVLLLKSLGIHDLVNFDFMDPPPAEALLRALEQLYALGALNDRGELTKLGRRMAEFPLDPMLSKALLASEQYKVSEEVASVCAMVSIGSAVFYRPKDKAVHAENAHRAFSRGNVGDHIALLNVYNGWAESDFSSQYCFENYVQLRSMKRARDIREQLVNLMERVEIELVSDVENHGELAQSAGDGF